MIEPLQEMFNQQWNIALPVAQRRGNDRNHVEAIKEVLPESLLLDHFFQVLVGGRDNSDIDLNRPTPPHPLKGSFLYHSQKFDLKRETHLADFVEKDRSAIGKFESAHSRLGRAGEGALFMSEQF